MRKNDKEIGDHMRVNALCVVIALFGMALGYILDSEMLVILSPILCAYSLINFINYYSKWK